MPVGRGRRLSAGWMLMGVTWAAVACSDPVTPNTDDSLPLRGMVVASGANAGLLGIPLGSNAVAVTVPTGSVFTAGALAFSPDGGRVYVGHSDGLLTVIEIGTNTVIDSIRIASDYQSADIFVGPGGGHLYVPLANGLPPASGGIVVVRTDNMMVVDTIVINGTHPFTAIARFFAALPGSSTLYVNTSYGGIAQIDLPTGREVRRIPMDGGGRIALSPDGSLLLLDYLTEVRFIATGPGTVVGSVPIQSGIAAVFSPDGATAYVLDASQGSVRVVNVATRSIAATIPLPSQPWDLILTPDGAQLYVVIDDAIVVISTQSRSVSATIALTGDRRDPRRIAVNP